MSRFRALVVGEDPALLAALKPLQAEFEFKGAPTRAEALAGLAAEPFALVVSRQRLPDGTGLELLGQCAARFPQVKRVLRAAHGDLPEVLRLSRDLRPHRVVPETSSPARLLRLMEEVLEVVELSSSRKGPRRLDWAQLLELLSWTVERISAVRQVVVRPLADSPAVTQLQFVVPASGRLEELREEVVEHWLWPVKPRGAAANAEARGHPVVSLFGALPEGCEIYAQPLEDDAAWAYLALLPWQREARVTVALGLYVPQTGIDARAVVVGLHARALEGVRDFPLPAPEAGAAVEVVVPEYDWVATPGYAGPDRRGSRTSFLNRFMYRGRRAHVSGRIARVSHSFTDRLPPGAWRYFAAYAVLALADSALTWIFVRAGTVQELNPLFATLVLLHPVRFWVFKNAAALGLFALIARFHLTAVGKLAMRLLVGAYLVLDLYWVVLVTRGG